MRRVSGWSGRRAQGHTSAPCRSASSHKNSGSSRRFSSSRLSFWRNECSVPTRLMMSVFLTGDSEPCVDHGAAHEHLPHPEARERERGRERSPTHRLEQLWDARHALCERVKLFLVHAELGHARHARAEGEALEEVLGRRCGRLARCREVGVRGRGGEEDGVSGHACRAGGGEAARVSERKRRKEEGEEERGHAPLADPVLEDLGLGLAVAALFDVGTRVGCTAADDLAQERLCGVHREPPQDDGARLEDVDLADLARARARARRRADQCRGGPAREEDGFAEEVDGAVEESEGLEVLEQLGRVVGVGGGEGNDAAVCVAAVTPGAVARTGVCRVQADGEERGIEGRARDGGSGAVAAAV